MWDQLSDKSSHKIEPLIGLIFLYQEFNLMKLFLGHICCRIALQIVTCVNVILLVRNNSKPENYQVSFMWLTTLSSLCTLWHLKLFFFFLCLTWSLFAQLLVQMQVKKYQNSASQAFVRGIHRWPVKYPHKRPIMRKMFPCYDVIMRQILPAPLVFSSYLAFIASCQVILAAIIIVIVVFC